MKSNLKNVITHLKTRRGMYIPDTNSYHSLSSFLIGFSIGLNQHEKVNILDDFHKWLEHKEGKQFSLNWSSYILNELCSGNEIEAIDVSLDLLLEFSSDH